jgi:D-lactate dehydrogenase
MASVATEAPTHEADPSGNVEFLQVLRAIVGSGHVLTKASATRRYRTGFRFGTGPALAVVRPGSLVEQWKVLEACIAANKIVIMQASNTGLTGGSTPDGATMTARSSSSAQDESRKCE